MGFPSTKTKNKYLQLWFERFRKVICFDNNLQSPAIGIGRLGYFFVLQISKMTDALKLMNVLRSSSDRCCLALLILVVFITLFINPHNKYIEYGIDGKKKTNMICRPLIMKFNQQHAGIIKRSTKNEKKYDIYLQKNADSIIIKLNIIVFVDIFNTFTRKGIKHIIFCLSEAIAIFFASVFLFS